MAPARHGHPTPAGAVHPILLLLGFRDFLGHKTFPMATKVPSPACTAWAQRAWRLFVIFSPGAGTGPVQVPAQGQYRGHSQGQSKASAGASTRPVQGQYSGQRRGQYRGQCNASTGPVQSQFLGQHRASARPAQGQYKASARASTRPTQSQHKASAGPTSSEAAFSLRGPQAAQAAKQPQTRTGPTSSAKACGPY